MDRVPEARLVVGAGLEGNVDRSSRRQVTLLDAAAWNAALEALGASADPARRRANLLLHGLTLTGSRGRVLRIGECALVVGGELTPCERMDEVVPGLQARLRHAWGGGVFAQVMTGGRIREGDAAWWEGGES